ncbi:MAG: peroxiredoxin-like family protein [Spirochaetales bacterium]|uniref:thioredoxin-dependent peroxiredoxin n=1 Tax=Candidatus Thalassospirochaeta sargassi TaxID=3119039 RepID=A0AAJ1IH37_9SPIO|nr:peroxiredoxin-like family protein [Spirochaetales bacterium]
MKNEFTSKRLLSDDLNKKKADFTATASTEIKKIYADGLKSVRDDKIVEKALKVGDTAINFTLKNAVGDSVTLYEKLAEGPVILMWYRGGWCPYCNFTLHHMQEYLSEFSKYNAALIALTPEVPDKSMSSIEKHDLKFEVLSDLDNNIASEYKVVFKLTDDVAGVYEDKFGLSAYNGNNKAELPLAATYVIDTDKIIKYAFLDADYRKRAEPSDIVKFLKNNLQ